MVCVQGRFLTHTGGDGMTRTHLIARAAPLLASWPATAAASELGSSWSSGEVTGVAVLGVVAAVGWHHLAARRDDLLHRWHELHLADRWRGLDLAGRLHLGHARASSRRRSRGSRAAPAPPHAFSERGPFPR
jgi:hypothetical protein